MTTKVRKINPWMRVPRDFLLLISGILLTMNEALFREGPERPYMIMLFAGMMGLPLYLRSDEKKSTVDITARQETPDSRPEVQRPLEFRGLRLA